MRILSPFLALAGLAIASAAATRALHAARPGTANATLLAAIRPFPASQIDGAYEMTENEDFHYALPYASAAVRYAAYAVHRRYGRTAEPMKICDCSTAAGLTPSGRHPFGAHDGGVNFDITYFMKRPVDTFIVCPATSDNHCVGPALDLDADRQAYFFATLGQLDHQLDDGLLVCMAVDGWVKRALMPAFARLQMYGDFSPAVISHTEDLVYGEMVDQGTGWFRFHHNHTHLRFHPRGDDPVRLAGSIETRIARLLSPPPAAPRFSGPTPAPAAPAAPKPGTAAPSPRSAAPAPRAAVKPAPVIEAPIDSFVLVLPHRHGPGPRVVHPNH